MHHGHTFLLAAGASLALATGYFLMLGQKRPKNCVFCNQLDKVVYEDSKLLAFHDIKPDAALHLLVIPREHHGTVKELGPEDLPMLRRMLEIGQQLMEENGFSDSSVRFGFHRPPFNSIHHLHMHCLGLPFKSTRKEYMFPKDGARWFVPAETLIGQIERMAI
ncbi:hypothetical protein H4R24_005522 [Coemansia sp. RSA 988]|nr:hypothetical protein H4R24_005522 [Coemansia sp. RSA 988]